MFSFRRDKVGFFTTIILLVIVTGTVIAPGVLMIVGLAQGDWLAYSLAMKIILSSAWVGSIITVVVRVAIFRWQLHRQEQSQADAQPPDAEKADEGERSMDARRPGDASPA
jgi:hypothetical protein